MSDADSAIEAIRAGELVVLPTDTVYGLACAATDPEPARRLYALKGRPSIQPTAILAASVDVLLDCIPELKGDAAAAARALLPGPYTLVLANPARRFAWLNTVRPETVGVRVPVLPDASRPVLEAVGVVVATSANLAGEPDPRSVADVSPDVLAGVTAVIDGGLTAGVPSTVVDLTGPTPLILREGAVPAAEALARAAAIDR